MYSITDIPVYIVLPSKASILAPWEAIGYCVFAAGYYVNSHKTDSFRRCRPNVVTTLNYTECKKNKWRTPSQYWAALPFSPQKRLNLSGHGLYKVFESVPQGCWPHVDSNASQTCVKVWVTCAFGWWTILDTHGKLLSVEKSAALLCFFWHWLVLLATTTIHRFYI